MIQLKKIQRINPQDRTATRKYYVSTSSNGEVDLEEMSVNISEKCTLTEPDVLAVLSALSTEMSKQLMDGKIVRFGSFGSFQLGINSTGVDNEDDASRNQVKSVRVKFRPGSKVSTALEQLKFSLTS